MSNPYAKEAAPSAEVFIAEGAKKRKKKPVEIAIRLTKVTKRFGVKTAVDGVSLKVKAGSVYGLIGPNGAGKTTTFSMMAGFLQPTEGVLEVLGYSPMQVDELRSRIGVLPQDALLPGADKVGEFLVHMAQLQDVPADRCEEAAREVLAEVDGRDWWNVKCGSLSHGMAKRVQLAQALIGDPEVVLLDEPTAGLDPRVAYEVRQLIKSRKGRCTLIVSSHNLQELEEICDGAAILDRGRLVASGSMTELTASSEEIRIKLSPGPAPISLVRDLPMVKRARMGRGAPRARRVLRARSGRRRGAGDRRRALGPPPEPGSHQRRLEGPWPRAARDGAHRLQVVPVVPVGCARP